MNTFGHIFRVHIFGESHGHCVGITIDGCPPGMLLNTKNFVVDIERRKGGIQKGTTPRKEQDIPIFISGIFNDKTTGAPLTIIFENKNIQSKDYEKQRAIPRPGHADFVAHHKYKGFQDYRGGGHFSGRLTLPLVAAGVVAKTLLLTKYKKINIQSSIIEIGGEKNIEEGLHKAIDAKDSVGGIIECCVQNLPIGLGEPFFNSLESLISHIVFAIPAVRGIEFGTGFKAAQMFGSEHNDAIVNTKGKTNTNHAGGIVGGLSNGNDLVFRIAVKPASSTPKMQQSFNWKTDQIENFTITGRHDLCIALRVPVVIEAVTAIVLADCLLMRSSTL